MASVNRSHPIIDESELCGIGHRVVHGGDVFRAPTIIDDAVIAAIRELIPLAPLHNPANIMGIEVARARFPSVPHVAVFDTAFHQTLAPQHTTMRCRTSGMPRITPPLRLSRDIVRIRRSGGS